MKSICFLAASQLHFGFVGAQPANDFIGDFVERSGIFFAQGAFPDEADAPFFFHQNGHRAHIAGLVVAYFFEPEFRSRRRFFEKRAILVAMPEAAMDKNHRPKFRKNEVGRACQPPVVQPKPKPAPMQRPPNLHFGLRVGRADARHHLAALRGSDDVGHF